MVTPLDVAERSEFLFGLLRAYGIPKASISRLRSGSYNRSDQDGEYLWRDKVYYRCVDGADDEQATSCRSPSEQTAILVSMPNIFEPEWGDRRDEPPFRWRRARVGRQAGARMLGASIFEVPPGSATFPMHAHYANEELMVVLDGAPTLLTPEGERQLTAGEMVSFPAGLDGAHRVDNRSDDPVRLLVISTMLAPEINAMLEDGSLWVRDYPPGSDPPEDGLDMRLPAPSQLDGS